MAWVVLPTLEILDREVTYEYSRSPGPGGQHVNKVATQVTLCFDVSASAVLTDDQKARLRRKLGGRISRAGVLRVTSRKHRSQSANKRSAGERFGELMSAALRPVLRRIKTVVPRRAKRKRIEDKRHRADTKHRRQKPGAD